MGVHQGVFALARHGGGFARRVVPGQDQDAAQRRGAGKVGVAEDVAGTVDAGALAVPNAEHPVIARALEQVQLLAAP